MGDSHSGEHRKKFIEIAFYGVKLTFLTPEVFEEEIFFFWTVRSKQLLSCYSVHVIDDTPKGFEVGIFILGK